MNLKQREVLDQTFQAMEDIFTSNEFSRVFKSLGGETRVIQAGKMLKYIRSVANPEDPDSPRVRTWIKKGLTPQVDGIQAEGLQEIAGAFQWPEPKSLGVPLQELNEANCVAYLKGLGYRILKTVEV